jgi:hypothetical protein
MEKAQGREGGDGGYQIHFDTPSDCVRIVSSPNLRTEPKVAVKVFDATKGSLMQRCSLMGVTVLLLAVISMALGSPRLSQAEEAGVAAMVIDCRLPGQIRKLGTKLTFLTPQRMVRTTRTDCEIRGGESLV